MTTFQLTGLTAAPITPMVSNGDVNYNQIESLARLYEKNGVNGVFISGSTGEGTSLTFAEKKEILRVWAKVKGNLKALYCVGGTCIRDMQELVAMSAEYNLDGFAILPPYYFKPSSVELMVEVSKEIASAAPDLPFYYYHIPALSGCNYSMRTYLELAQNELPSLAGIKYSYPDLYDFQQARMFAGEKYNMLWGTDEVLLSALVAGTDGAVGSTYNYAAPLYHKIIKAFESGDMEEAKKWQDKSLEMVKLLIKYGGTGATKAFMRIIGMESGDYRLPIKTPSLSETKKLEGELKEIGFFDFCSQM